MKKRIDEEVAGGNKTVELTFVYFWTYYNTDHCGFRDGKEMTEFIDIIIPHLVLTKGNTWMVLR